MRILVVEPDVAFRQKVTSQLLLLTEIEGLCCDYRFVETDDGRHAVDLLKSTPGFDYLIINPKLPDIDGFQILAWLQSKGEAVPTVLVGELDQLQAPRLPEWATWLDRPESKSTGRFCQRLHALISRGPRGDNNPMETTGMSGDLEALSIPELVSTLAMKRQGTSIHVETPFGSGDIWVETGKVVGARFRGLLGEQAAYALCRPHEGRFSTGHSEVPREAQLCLPSDLVLLEAARLMDMESAVADAAAAAHEARPKSQDRVRRQTIRIREIIHREVTINATARDVPADFAQVKSTIIPPASPVAPSTSLEDVAWVIADLEGKIQKTHRIASNEEAEEAVQFLLFQCRRIQMAKGVAVRQIEAKEADNFVIFRREEGRCLFAQGRQESMRITDVNGRLLDFQPETGLAVA